MQRSLIMLALVVQSASAQTGSFVATLGRDTVHLERFSRQGNILDGVIVTRIPETRIARYQMTYDASGVVTRYEFKTTDANGTPLRHNGAAGSLVYTRDSIIRRTIDKGEETEQRIAAPNGAFHSPSIPYVGVSYLMYEEAFNAARRRSSNESDPAIYLITMLAGQREPQRSRIWFVGADSAELNYFNVARSGYRFDDKGRLIRADWTGTTYRYQIRRGADVDVESFARRWSEDDKRGAGLGALSPRDTSRATVGDAAIAVEYSRPAARGRNIWGDVVHYDKVWRLGADVATHFSTTADLTVGGAKIPAGRYTIWMQLSRGGASYLIVNKRVNIFGTMYDEREDFARIPLERVALPGTVERLTIGVVDGKLRIAWGDAAWVAPVERSAASRP
jgi:Protein of unknown function (DUF2911)